MNKKVNRTIIFVLTELVLLSSLSCHVKKGKATCLDRSNNVSTYSYSDGNVLIVDPENIDAALNVKKENDTLVLDMRNENNPGIKVKESSEITDARDMRQIIEAIQDYNDNVFADNKWSRSTESMIIEWEIHNILYNLGLFNSHTEDVDFNQNELANILKNYRY